MAPADSMQVTMTVHGTSLANRLQHESRHHRLSMLSPNLNLLNLR
ncbi:MAG: hypothetical protein JWQ11_2391 [Rhizobacter sp.]|nr:hypothetical protein [Rhizobacter sp.]